MDAAYVAERVLALEELKDYVDRFWPAASAEQVAQEQARFGASEVSPVLLREQIRYLLARRLTREWRGSEARAYYPADWMSTFDQLLAALRTGWEETADAAGAASLFQAALITRTNGMELIGTEVAPDWHYHLGQFEEGVTGEDRRSNTLAVVVRPSEDELRRDAQHRPDPDLRFHYRYQAAALAWEAARLLPDNDDRTAYVLWQGGSFLKYRDPQFADLFYKALVRRNRKTILGAEADRQRWFPIIDENGNILPRKQKTAGGNESSEAPETPMVESPSASDELQQNSEDAPDALQNRPDLRSGYEYVVRSGDSLASIAHAFSEAGVSVTSQDIRAANPGLERLRVGQRLFIPASAH